MLRLFSALVMAAVLAAAPPAASLRTRIDAAIASSPAAQRAFWGIQVADAKTGRLHFSLNPDRYFVPASNAKLFTTALALMRLGPDHIFQTVIASALPPDAEGRLTGDLVLIGGGDPSLSPRQIPYVRGPITGDPLAAIEQLADQVVARGVRRIDGDVAGDDSAYAWEPYPEGWAQDDAIYEYGAPVSALTVNDNVFVLNLAPAGAPSDPPLLTLAPPLEYFAIDNRVRWGPGLDRDVIVERPAGSRQLRLTGTLPALPSSGLDMQLAIDDPAGFAAYALADALTRRGVAIRGRAVARHCVSGAACPVPQPAYELARRASPRLIELLRIVNKVSQNLHAEMLLREVARVRRGEATRKAGIEERKAFLAEVGIPETEYDLEDGSGLSRLDLVTPAAVMRLLLYMQASPYGESWVSLLPVGGQDGTLWTRFNGETAGARVLAKTGTLSHVAALSGYADSPSRGRLAFTILVNNFNGPSEELRTAVDQVALAIAK